MVSARFDWNGNGVMERRVSTLQIHRESRVPRQMNSSLLRSHWVCVSTSYRPVEPVDDGIVEVAELKTTDFELILAFVTSTFNLSKR